MKVERRTVDLSAYPDLVVIYLGLRANAWTGLKTLLGFGPQIEAAAKAKPEGLLLHESNLIFSLVPPHVVIRQCWRDFDALEPWARSAPHGEWRQRFLKDSGGTGFWHETYFMRGGMEAVYDDLPKPIGMMRFAPIRSARGPMFSASSGMGLGASAADVPQGVGESDLYEHAGAEPSR